MVAKNTVIVRNDAILSAAVGGETVLMSAEQGQYYALTATSHDIWDRLKTPIRVADLCTALAEAYGVPLETVETDTLAFLEYLESQAMIKTVQA
ncbi:PqqD family peptide modification chaperone [Elstera cyanobacteriorum]|uniref:PqqD family peptide modification chaperone n=1 Tax=Elstera cyanobacteriorum TaxID=2022747 RepID=UPI0023579EFF|nr:PqqD family peptide modification chaperone [Elstera cyanobacteriorum]MCK6444621.1 PqqD family peptide modification chaperone [Elstera cyanobacteriorum]